MKMITELGCALCVVLGSAAAHADDMSTRTVHFNRDIRPILSSTCFACHGPDNGNREADLRLDTEAGLNNARATGILPSSPGKTGELLDRITSNDPKLKMPPPASRHKLTRQQVTLLRLWISQGAPWQKHWAYIVPTRPSVPKGPGLDGASSPIDRFVLKQMQEHALKPSPTADRATLIRRLSLDLTGLPPTLQEVDSFSNDQSPNAYEKVVHRLLASKHHGERLALYWLDLVRYADTVGYHKDSHRSVWLYRDYVVDSFNENKPFDQFVVEQLAGDLMKGTKFEQYRWKVASGLNRMNQTTSEGGAQAKEYLAIYSADRVRNTAAIFLGSTMGCAECHDHKYDPFTQRDFYSFAAFFADLKERGVGHPGETPIPSKEQLEKWQALETQLASLRKQDPKSEKIKAIESELKQISDAKNWPKMVITIPGKARDIRILPRGNWQDDSGPIVSPAIPAFLGSLPVKGRATRLDLANWIVSGDNPLTARVFVNRLWRLLFGRGLSQTLDDLGAQGQWPTHPELLDWLAVEFIESGWNVRHVVKLIVMTDAYRRSSTPAADQHKLDPENRYFARQARWRLDAELVRDNALAVSGLLSRKSGGPSVRPYQPANYWFRLYKDANYNQDHGENLYRRGLYTYWRRSFWHPSLRAFDAPAREECVAERPRSNTPQQSLVLLNDPTYVEAARVFAARVIHESGSSDKDRLGLAFRLALSRNPTKRELDSLTRFVSRQMKRFATDKAAAEKIVSAGESPQPKDIPLTEYAAWTAVARVVLNLHETISRE